MTIPLSAHGPSSPASIGVPRPVGSDAASLLGQRSARIAETGALWRKVWKTLVKSGRVALGDDSVPTHLPWHPARSGHARFTMLSGRGVFRISGDVLLVSRGYTPKRLIKWVKPRVSTNLQTSQVYRAVAREFTTVPCGYPMKNVTKCWKLTVITKESQE
jgi:hypothetical protein